MIGPPRRPLATTSMLFSVLVSICTLGAARADEPAPPSQDERDRRFVSEAMSFFDASSPRIRIEGAHGTLFAVDEGWDHRGTQWHQYNGPDLGWTPVEIRSRSGAHVIRDLRTFAEGFFAVTTVSGATSEQLCHRSFDVPDWTCRPAAVPDDAKLVYATSMHAAFWDHEAHVLVVVGPRNVARVLELPVTENDLGPQAVIHMRNFDDFVIYARESPMVSAVFAYAHHDGL